MKQIEKPSDPNSKIRFDGDLANTSEQVPVFSDFRDHVFPQLYLFYKAKFEVFCEKLINGKLINQNQKRTKMSQK